MKFSFFGLSKPASKVSDALSRAIKEYRAKISGAPSPLSPDGVYIPNLDVCTEFASSRKMAVYMNINDLIRKSDVIFTFLSGSTLKNIHKTLRRLEIKNKIFCHFNPEYDAEILDFGPDNTYVSILIPATRKNGTIDLSYGLISQGYGPRYEDFLDSLEKLGIKVKDLNVDEKCIYQGAVNIIKHLPSLAIDSSKRLAKSILGPDSEILNLFDDMYSLNEHTLSSYSPYDSGDTEYIDNQKKLMKNMGLEDAELFYAVLLLAKSFNADLTSSQNIKDIAKSIIRKL